MATILDINHEHVSLILKPAGVPLRLKTKFENTQKITVIREPEAEHSQDVALLDATAYIIP